MEVTAGSVEHALAIAKRGWAVFPLQAKIPFAGSHGFKDAVSDEESICALWEKYARPDGVGIRTGEPSGIWVLDVDTMEGHGEDGEESLYELISQYGELPETLEAWTPSQGRHLYFAYTSPVACGTLLPGVDFKGDGGYVVAPGSTHPDFDELYSWELGSRDNDIQPAPAWLIELLQNQSSSSGEGGHHPHKGDLRELLVGWNRTRVSSRGVEYWKRPGSTNAYGAILYPADHIWANGRLQVFTPNGGLDAGTYGWTSSNALKEMWDPWFDEVELHIEEMNQARIEAEQDEFDDGWLDIDLIEASKKGPPPPPDLLEREDGELLLYAGKLHYFYGLPESGKSWAGQLATKQAIAKGKPVGYLDFENDEFSFLERLEAQGVEEDGLELIMYKAPDKRPIRDLTIPRLRRQLEKLKPALIIVDGMSNAMGLFGFVPESSTDAVNFEYEFLRVLTDSGAAVVCIDHAPKNQETPTIFGSQHKLAQVTGAAFYFKIVSPFGRGMRGQAQILIKKDKPGYLRRHALFDGYVGDLIIDARDKFEAKIRPPVLGEQKEWVPDGIMNNLWKYIHDNPGSPEAVVLANVYGQDSYKAAGLKMLIDEGYVGRDLGNGRLYPKQGYGIHAIDLDNLGFSGARNVSVLSEASGSEAMDRVRKAVKRGGWDPFGDEEDSPADVVGSLAEPERSEGEARPPFATQKVEAANPKNPGNTGGFGWEEDWVSDRVVA